MQRDENASRNATEGVPYRLLRPFCDCASLLCLQHVHKAMYVRQGAEVPDEAGAFESPEVPADLVGRAVVLVEGDVDVVHAAVGLDELHHLVGVLLAEWVKD